MNKKSETDQYSDKETERRMTGAIQRALNTPPKPFTKPAKGKKKSTANKQARKRTADHSS